MKKINFNRQWEFILENNIDEFSTHGIMKYSDAAGAPARFYANNNWDKIDLPHDWTLSLEKSLFANAMSGSYPNTRYHRSMTERHADNITAYNVGWYRKEFQLDPEWEGKRIFIEFEGIYRDSMIWVNGVYLDRHASGYTSFAIELTDHLLFGEDNSIAVRVDCEQAEGWWYEGAGIYRNVNLHIGEPVYFKYNQTVVTTELDGSVCASAILVNDTTDEKEVNVLFTVADMDGSTVATSEAKVSIPP